MAVAPQPCDAVLAVDFHAHGVGGRRSDGAVVEAARGGRVGPAADAAPHPDGVVGLVEPQACDLDSVLEERSGRAERARTPSLLQGLVAADQHDATRHGRLSSSLGSISATTSVYRMRRSDPYTSRPGTCSNGPPRAKTHTANAPVEITTCVTGGRRPGSVACFHVHQAVRMWPGSRARMERPDRQIRGACSSGTSRIGTRAS